MSVTTVCFCGRNLLGNGDCPSCSKNSIVPSGGKTMMQIPGFGGPMGGITMNGMPMGGMPMGGMPFDPMTALLGSMGMPMPMGMPMGMGMPMPQPFNPFQQPVQQNVLGHQVTDPEKERLKQRLDHLERKESEREAERQRRRQEDEIDRRVDERLRTIFAQQQPQYAGPQGVPFQGKGHQQFAQPQFNQRPPVSPFERFDNIEEDSDSDSD